MKIYKQHEDKPIGLQDKASHSILAIATILSRGYLRLLVEKSKYSQEVSKIGESSLDVSCEQSNEFTSS